MTTLRTPCTQASQLDRRRFQASWLALATLEPYLHKIAHQCSLLRCKELRVAFFLFFVFALTGRLLSFLIASSFARRSEGSQPGEFQQFRISLERLTASEKRCRSMFQYCRDVLHLSGVVSPICALRPHPDVRSNPMVLTMPRTEPSLERHRDLWTVPASEDHGTHGRSVELRGSSRPPEERTLAQRARGRAHREPDVPASVRKVPRKLPRRERRRCSGNAAQKRPEVSSETHLASGEPPTTSGGVSRTLSSGSSESRDPREGGTVAPALIQRASFTASVSFVTLERRPPRRRRQRLAGVIARGIVSGESVERLDVPTPIRWSRSAQAEKEPRRRQYLAGTLPASRSAVHRDSWRGSSMPHGTETLSRRTRVPPRRVPTGSVGDQSAGNVRLLCRVHNLYMAEKDYGKKKMDDYRRSADTVREPAPSFELRPDGAQHPSQHRAVG